MQRWGSYGKFPALFVAVFSPFSELGFLLEIIVALLMRLLG